jgi:hypothetical protein
MSCFTNCISYKGSCGSTVPTSGLYTDQIGLHKTEIEQYLQAPYQNADEMFNDFLNISIEEMKNDIYTKFSPTYKAKSIIDSARLGMVQDNMTLKPGSAGVLGGIEIEICKHNSPLEIFISQVSLFCDTTGTITVNVWDLKQDLIISTFNVDAVANQVITAYPAINIKANNKSMHLLFAYDTSTVDSYETILVPSSCGSCTTNRYYKQNWVVKARGVTVINALPKIESSINFTNHTSGLSLVYSVNCAHEDWICNSNRLFALPIMYKTVANILQYGLFSTDRMNDKTLVDRDKIQQRINICLGNYSQKMNDITERISPPNDPICYACNSPIKFVVHEP